MYLSSRRSDELRHIEMNVYFVVTNLTYLVTLFTADPMPVTGPVGVIDPDPES